MRFLMLNWRDPRNPLAGGAERVSLAFMRGLKERGHEVDWFTFAFPGGAPEEWIDGIRVRRAGGVFTSILAARRWHRLQAPYDLVIDQHHGVPWFAPWWCRTRCLAYIHEVLGPVWKSFYRWPTSWIGEHQERWTHWLYRRVPFWVPSDSTRLGLQANGVRQVHVLPNGVDLEPLESLPAKPWESPLRLIAVSRLAPNKRVDHAVQAVAELRRQGVPAALTVVGDGIEMTRLRALSASLGLGEAVRFTGFVSEAEKLRHLQASHLLVHPSVREGWGLNVIEANAMGTPAVVYPVGGLVDSTVDRITGVICAHETPEAIARAVKWILEGEGRYAALRQEAWKWAQGFRWKVVIPPVMEFLESQASNQKMG